MSYTNATLPGNRQNEWLKSLDFYKQELDILENRLAEVAGKNNSQEARAGVEHFQNQFMIQRKNISGLKHRIKAQAHLAYEDVQTHAGHVDKTRLEELRKMEDDVKTFEAVIGDLRSEFNSYLVKWM